MPDRHKQERNTMTLAVRLLLVFVLGMVAIFLIKKMVEALYNILELRDKTNAYDTTKQRNGMVLNLRTKKLEADQSAILPFE